MIAKALSCIRIVKHTAEKQQAVPPDQNLLTASGATPWPTELDHSPASKP
jgi:hypothetical protein